MLHSILSDVLQAASMVPAMTHFELNVFLHCRHQGVKSKFPKRNLIVVPTPQNKSSLHSLLSLTCASGSCLSVRSTRALECLTQASGCAILPLRPSTLPPSTSAAAQPEGPRPVIHHKAASTTQVTCTPADKSLSVCFSVQTLPVRCFALVPVCFKITYRGRNSAVHDVSSSAVLAVLLAESCHAAWQASPL